MFKRVCSLTWKFISGVVKPKQTEAVRGVCHVRLTDTDRQALENDVEDIEPEDMEPVSAPVPVVAAAPLKVAVETTVEDSDDDIAGPPPALSESVEAVPPTPKVVKKIVKKKIVTA